MLHLPSILCYYILVVRERDVELSNLFDRVYRELGRREAPPEIHATFYPFASLRHTVRLREHRLWARLSDILRDAPEEILECIAHILLAKLYRRKIKAEHLNIYKAYTLDEAVEQRSREVRRLRSGKVHVNERGRVYNLREIFDRLNEHYFGGRLLIRQLSWTKDRTKWRLGYYDDVRHRIVISQSLDDARVPRMVLEFVLYHEMLHVVHESRVNKGRRCFHHHEFLHDEKRFLHYREVQAFLEHWTPRPRSKRRRHR